MPPDENNIQSPPPPPPFPPQPIQPIAPPVQTPVLSSSTQPTSNFIPPSSSFLNKKIFLIGGLGIGLVAVGIVSVFAFKNFNTPKLSTTQIETPTRDESTASEVSQFGKLNQETESSANTTPQQTTKNTSTNTTKSTTPAYNAPYTTPAPQIKPAYVKGNAYINTKSIPAELAPRGTLVEAIINGNVCGSDTLKPADGYTTDIFNIEVKSASQQTGCGVDGSNVSFRVLGKTALQQTTFKPGETLGFTGFFVLSF